MDFKLSELELCIIVILDNSPTISELAKRTGVTAGYISRLITSLQHKGFVEVSKTGITKHVRLSSNLHAVKLKTTLHNRSYMPLTRLLAGSNIQVFAVLSAGKADITRLLDESGISEATIRRNIRAFKKYAIVLHRDTEYELSQDLKDIREFLRDYCSYFAVSTLNKISSQGRFIASHGFEFLFASDITITLENIKPTGLTEISKIIPLMQTENHYFYSLRELSCEEIAVHAITIDPYNKRNLTYVILYMLKTKTDSNRFIKISHQYGIDIAKSIVNLINTWKQPEEKFMPSPLYIKQKAVEYDIKWHE
ncbi:MAG: MarR family transcriptional regulator [Methanosarcinales archaeon]|nr:MarR family transcriptional regulator [Methanosarcinales archaeon]